MRMKQFVVVITVDIIYGHVTRMLSVHVIRYGLIVCEFITVEV